MVEVNKVEVGFTADVSAFNHGVDRMERKLQRFEKDLNAETARVNKRFDLMTGSMRRVEKSIGSLDENTDLSNLHKNLKRAQSEFVETGKVSEDAFRRLQSSANNVDFDKLDKNTRRSITHIQKDVGKLRGSLTSLGHLNFAQELDDDAKLVATDFARLRKAFNSTELSARHLRNSMSSKELQAYRTSLSGVQKSLSAVEKEFRQTGTISSQTFQRMKNDINSVNFNKLPKESAKAFGQVKRHTQNLSREFDRMGGHISRNGIRFRALSNTVQKHANSMSNKFESVMVTFNRWGTRFRNIQEVAEHVFGGVMIPLLSSLIPVSGTATTAIMGIGAGLGSVAGYAVGLGGAFGIAFGGVKAFAAQATSALQMLEDGELRVTSEVKRYQSALKGLQGDWKSLINQNQAHIFNTMSNGIAMARYGLAKLNPFLVKTAGQIEVASQKMHKWVTSSQNAQRAFNMLNRIGPPIFQNVLNSAGHFGNGLTRIFTAFGPLFTWTGQQLEKLSKKFDIWANSANTQRGIAQFINYTKQNIPILGSIFTNTFIGIINLFKAFSGQTTWAMKGLDGLTEKFRNWSANLDKTQGFKEFLKFNRENAPVVGKFIGNLFTVLVELIKAMAPVTAITLKFTTAMLGFIGATLKAHPALGKLIASFIIFFGLMKTVAFLTALVTQFTAVRKAITLLIGTQRAGAIANGIFTSSMIKQNGVLRTMRLGYTWLIAKIRSFNLAQKLSMITTKAWTLVTKGAVLANRLLALSFKGIGRAIYSIPGFGWILLGITALVTGITLLWKHSQTFRTIVLTIWASIKYVAVNTFTFLANFFKTVWSGIGPAWSASWAFIKRMAVIAWNGIKYAITHPIKSAKAVLSLEWALIRQGAVLAWQGIRKVSSAIWAGIRAVVVGSARRIASGVRGAISGLRNFFVFAWTSIKNASIVSWQIIRNAVVGSARRLVSGVKAVIGGLRTWFVVCWTFIKNRTVALANLLSKGVRGAFSRMGTAIRKTIGFLRTWLIKAWTFIRNRIVSLARSIYKNVTLAFSRLGRGIRNTIGKLRTWLVKAWTYIRNKIVSLARSIYRNVSSAFSRLGKSIRNIVAKLRTWLVKAWTYIRNKIVSLARSMLKGVVNLYNRLSKNIRNIINNLRKFLVKAWSYIRNKIVSLARSMYKAMISTYNRLSKSIRNIISNLRKFLIKAWSYIRNKVVSLAKSLWNGVRRTFTSLYKGVVNLTSKARNGIVNGWKKIKSSVTGLASSMWRKVRGIFSTMVGGIRKFTGRIKSSMLGMVTSVKRGLNKLISGVNWVGSKLGMGKQMIKPIALSTGTSGARQARKYTANGKISQGTMAVVGDKGKGNGPGGFRNETITYPNGKQVITPGTDTLAYLPKGSTVHNGAQTYAGLSQGTLPQFSFGSGVMGAVSNMIGGGKKPPKKKAHEHNDVATDAKNKLGKVWGGAKAMAGDAGHAVGSAVGKGVDTAKGWVKTAGKAVSKVAGEVESWIEHPGKLMNAVVDKFGFNFNALKGAEMPFKLMQGAKKQLITGAKKKVSGWLEEYGGGGDGGFIKYLDNITTPYSPHGPPPGYAFSWPHGGIDLPYIYEKVQSTVSGVARGKEMPGGFGHYIQVDSKPYDVIYGHLSKWLIKQGQRVHPGTTLGITGNTGASTGPHLHYEMRKHGTGQTIDPVKWLKSHNGSGGKSGGSRKASAWRPEVIRALRMNHLPTSSAYVNAWIRQIDSESGGNAGVTQHGYVDVNTGGNEAQGLVQVIPPTFNAFKFPGHGNIRNGLDNLLAGIHYAKSKYGSDMLGVIGHGHGYENGGLINSPELAWLAEGGFSESIISHDPANKVKSKAIHDRTGEMLGFNDDTAILRRVESLLQEHTAYTRSIDDNTRRTADKSNVIQMNGRAVAKEIAEDTNEEIKRIEARKTTFKRGGGR